MILLIGAASDPHVMAVSGILSDEGHNFCVLDPSDPESDGIHVAIAESLNLNLGRGLSPGELIGAIWWRHKPRMGIPSEKAADLYDYYFVSKEWSHTLDFLGIAMREIPCINPREAASRANNKLHQLKVAAAHGFAVPRTLVSNNFTQIAQFAADLSPTRMIYKTLSPYMNPIGRLTYTTLVDREMLRSQDSALKVCPGIFQEYISKSHELRITVVGSAIFAARVNS